MNSAVCILATGYKIGRECAAVPASGPPEMGTWLMYQTHSYTFRFAAKCEWAPAAGLPPLAAKNLTACR